jgi:hypothetical protein
MLAWYHQRRALAPYLGQFLGLSLPKSPGIYMWNCPRHFFMGLLLLTIVLDEMSIGESLISGFKEPCFIRACLLSLEFVTTTK